MQHISMNNFFVCTLEGGLSCLLFTQGLFDTFVRRGEDVQFCSIIGGVVHNNKCLLVMSLVFYLTLCTIPY